MTGRKCAFCMCLIAIFILAAILTGCQSTGPRATSTQTETTMPTTGRGHPRTSGT
jgi:hypothetical protein